MHTNFTMVVSLEPGVRQTGQEKGLYMSEANLTGVTFNLCRRYTSYMYSILSVYESP